MTRDARPDEMDTPPFDDTRWILYGDDIAVVNDLDEPNAFGHLAEVRRSSDGTWYVRALEHERFGLPTKAAAMDLADQVLAAHERIWGEP